MVWGAILIGVAIFLIARMVISWVFLSRKVSGFQFPEDHGPSVPGAPLKRNTAQFSKIGFVQRSLRRQPLSKRLLLYLRRARWGISVAVLLLICFSLAVVCLLVVEDKLPLLLSLALSLGVGALPLIYLRMKNEKYVNLFCERLPDGLMTLSGGIKVGLSLDKAVREVVNNAPYPVALEFKIVSGEVALGSSMEKAFYHLSERIPRREVRILATAIAIHSQLGGNLSELLVNLQNTIRERLAIQREIRVLSAQGIFTALVLVFLPVFMAGVYFSMDRENFLGFLSSEMGKTVLWVVFLSLTGASLMIRKIIKVDD